MIKLDLEHYVCQCCPHFEAVVEKTWEDGECITLIKCDKFSCKYMTDKAIEIARAAAQKPECDLIGEEEIC